jgi:hypothetical protein
MAPREKCPLTCGDCDREVTFEAVGIDAAQDRLPGAWCHPRRPQTDGRRQSVLKSSADAPLLKPPLAPQRPHPATIPFTGGGGGMGPFFYPNTTLLSCDFYTPEPLTLAPTNAQLPRRRLVVFTRHAPNSFSTASAGISAASKPHDGSPPIPCARSPEEWPIRGDSDAAGRPFPTTIPIKSPPSVDWPPTNAVEILYERDPFDLIHEHWIWSGASRIRP